MLQGLLYEKSSSNTVGLHWMKCCIDWNISCFGWGCWASFWKKQHDDENKECNRVLLFVATRYATYTEHVSQKLLEAYRQPNQDQVGGLCYSRRLLLYIAAEAGSSSPCSYIVGRQPKKSILSQTLEACTRCKDWDGWYCLDRFDALLWEHKKGGWLGGMMMRRRLRTI